MNSFFFLSLNVWPLLMSYAQFLSPFGIRSLSRHHLEHPYVLHLGGQRYQVDYTPGDSATSLFGGNSNWRGPVWFPMNFLLIEALERLWHFYGDSFKVENHVHVVAVLTVFFFFFFAGGRSYGQLDDV